MNSCYHYVILHQHFHKILMMIPFHEQFRSNSGDLLLFWSMIIESIKNTNNEDCLQIFLQEKTGYIELNRLYMVVLLFKW